MQNVPYLIGHGEWLLKLSVSVEQAPGRKKASTDAKNTASGVAQARRRIVGRRSDNAAASIEKWFGLW